MTMTTSERGDGMAGWRVVIFTSSAGAFQFLSELFASLGHRIAGVITAPGPRDRRADDYLQVAGAAALTTETIVSNRPARWAGLVRALEPDLIVSVAFPLRIPAEVIALPRIGAINGHDALLPKYRGPNPQGWMFRNGDAKTGYTVHRLAPEFDAGPILSQVEIPVLDDDDFDSLFGRLIPELPGVFTRALERLEAGEIGESQDEAMASAAPFFEPEWQSIDWTRPARTIHNQVRSLFPLPGQPGGALAELGDETLRILKTRLMPTPTAARQPDPGTILARDAGWLLVQCGDGPLQVVDWREETV
jgi:methionyl-tRNA formyltransferase